MSVLNVGDFLLHRLLSESIDFYSQFINLFFKTKTLAFVIIYFLSIVDNFNNFMNLDIVLHLILSGLLHRLTLDLISINCSWLTHINYVLFWRHHMMLTVFLRRSTTSIHTIGYYTLDGLKLGYCLLIHFNYYR